MPSVCLQNGYASLEEVVNMLAEKAMKYNYYHNHSIDEGNNFTRSLAQEKATSEVTAADETTTESNKTVAAESLNSADPSDDKIFPANPQPSSTISLLESEYIHASNKAKYVHDVLDVLPKLQYGMDVNPKFTHGVEGMEFTTELTTFDLLNVKLVHGWLLDPESNELAQLINGKTYNELIEIVIHGSEAAVKLKTLEEQILKLKDCPDDVWVEVGVPADETEDGDASKTTRQSVGHFREHFRREQEELSKMAQKGSLIQNFLDTSCHQLTQHGLYALHEHLAENEMCILFRNNHFGTLTRHEGALYLLVTDLGYANVPNVVWEKIDVIDGDTEYVDASFRQPAPQAELSAQHQSSQGFSTIEPDEILAQRCQSELDYQLAMQLSGMSHQAAGNNNASAGATRAPGGSVKDQTAPQANLDELEGHLMAAATEASLRTSNGVDDRIVKGSTPNELLHQEHTTQEEHDHLLAMQMQARMEQQDLMHAQQQQESEWARRQQSKRQAATTAANSNTAKSNCIIS